MPVNQLAVIHLHQLFQQAFSQSFPELIPNFILTPIRTTRLSTQNRQSTDVAVMDSNAPRNFDQIYYNAVDEHATNHAPYEQAPSNHSWAGPNSMYMDAAEEERMLMMTAPHSFSYHQATPSMPKAGFQASVHQTSSMLSGSLQDTSYQQPPAFAAQHEPLHSRSPWQEQDHPAPSTTNNPYRYSNPTQQPHTAYFQNAHPSHQPAPAQTNQHNSQSASTPLAPHQQNNPYPQQSPLPLLPTIPTQQCQNCTLIFPRAALFFRPKASSKFAGWKIWRHCHFCQEKRINRGRGLGDKLTADVLRDPHVAPWDKMRAYWHPEGVVECAAGGGVVVQGWGAWAG